MKKTVKQVVGIDVAQDELVVCLGKMVDDLSHELFANKTFINNSKGFALLQAWVNKMTDPSVGIRYVMEATGVYHEKLAYYLSDNTCTLSIVLPSKISNYFRSLNVKTITDKTASEAIARFGLERNLDDWMRPQPVYKKLRQLTRERDQLVEERTMVKNQLHAEKAEAQPNASSLQRIKKRIALLEKQEQEVNQEIKTLVSQDEKLAQLVKRICTMPGVGILTAAIVLAETNGFELIRNKKQLTSYAGLDVKEKQSGTSVKGKAHISKRGNKHLRKALHMPALSLIRSNERYKAIFARLVARHGIKMKAAVAIQRKLLEMIYTLYKTNAVYDENYLAKKNREQLIKVTL
jgi:transposase